MAGKQAAELFRNRIIGYGTKAADQFQANPLNYRKHPQRQRDAVNASLRELGWIGVVVENVTTGHLLDGHERVWQALAQNEDVPYVQVQLTEAEERLALAVFDPITNMAETDAAILDDLLREVNTGEAALQALLGELAEGAGLYGDKPTGDTEPQTDRAEELRQQWGVESGQMWQLGDHRLICGDCTDAATVARVMDNGLADCVFTSPPYAVGVDYGETYQDTIDNLRGMLPKLSRLWLDVVASGGFAVVNFGDVAGGRNIAKVDEPCEYPMAVEYWPVFRADGWLLWSRRVWCKPTARVNALWCIQSNRAATDWEHIWTWRKHGDPIIKRVDGDFSSVNGWIDTSRLHGVDVGKDEHGAGMATGIAEWMVTVHSRAGALVHEPFCGTGTTLIACENLKRKCMAIEISPSFTAIALQRWADHTGKTPVLLGA